MAGELTGEGPFVAVGGWRASQGAYHAREARFRPGTLPTLVSLMEAFEQFVAVALEAEGFVVSSAVKFRVKRATRKAAYKEIQEHGYEVDLVGARADRLILATVKSFFGSRGVAAEHVDGSTKSRRSGMRYILLNDPLVRDGVIKAACQAYGYRTEQVQLRLYVGKFAAPRKGNHREAIREWGAAQRVGAGSIEVFGVQDVLKQVMHAAEGNQYRDNAVLTTIRVLRAAGALDS